MMSKPNTPSHKQTLQKGDQQDKKPASSGPQSTRIDTTNHSPPAFNPNYVKHDATSSSSSPSSPSSSSSSRHSYSSSSPATASSPIEMQTVDPLIASIFQQGFPSNYNHHAEDFINNVSDHSASWLLLQDKENGLENIEYVIMDEPEEIITTPTAPKRTSRVSFLYKPNSSNTTASKNSKISHQQPCTPPPKIVQLTEQGNHYGKAQILAWRTQRASKAALRKALQLPKKHIHKPKALQKSVEVVKEVSLRSVELARKHNPIMNAAATRRRYSR